MAPTSTDAVDAVLMLLDQLEGLLADLRRVAETLREEAPGAGTDPTAGSIDPGS